MKKNQNIPSHNYSESIDKIENVDGEPIQSLDPEFPFALTKFEDISGQAQADYPHSHDSYEILFISEGEGSHIVDFEPYPVQAPVFYFISKGQIHFWQLTKPLKGYALLFPEEFLGFPSSNVIRAHDFTFFDHVGHAPFLNVDQEHLEMTGRLLKDIELEFYNENERSITVLRSYLHILLTKLHRLYVADHPDDSSEATSSLVREFNRLVSEHFLQEHSVQEYADRIGISASHLRDSVKAVTGHSPGHIIRQKLMLEAKRLLANSNETVSEICYHVNFEDPSYFGRFFKRETGRSPAAFRREVREKYRIDKE